MSNVEANLDAIRHLRAALVNFADRQSDAMSGVESAIASTLQALQSAEQHWRNQVEIRRDRVSACLQEAAYAAEQGYWVDCADDENALYAAEEQLARIIRMQYQVERTVDTYLAARQRVQDALSNDLSRAATYLDNILAGLETVLDLRVATVPPPTPDLTGTGETKIIFYDGNLPAPSPGPSTPPERKEGFPGGPERKG